MVLSLFVINDQSTWPAPWALLPVLSTGAVIAAGTGAPARFLWPLTNSVSGFIGDISYSLYLWHFPLIVLIGYMMDAGPAYYILTLLTIAACSIASYYAVEKPIHTSPVWSKFKNHDQKKRAWTTWREDTRGPASIAGTALAAVVGLTLAAGAMSLGQVSASNAAPPPQVVSAYDSGAVVPPFGSATKALQQRIVAASSSTSWPNFSPSIDEQTKDRYEKGINECNNRDVPAVSADCTFGSSSAKHTAVIAGDSIAGKWANDLFHLYAKDDWKLIVLSKYGCPFNTSDKVPAKNQVAACRTANTAVASAIRSLKPDMLFLSSNHFVLGTASVEDWRNGFAQQLSKSAGAKKVVVLTPPPTRGQKFNPTTCITPKSTPASCLTYVPPQWTALYNAEWDTVRKLHGGVVADTRPMFCTTDGKCPLFEGDLLIRRDAYHMADDFMTQTRPAFVELLRAYGVDVPGEAAPADYQPFPAESTSSSTPAQALSSKISAALQASTFPDLNPDPDTLSLDALRDQWTKDGCADVDATASAISKCTFGPKDAKKTVVVVGDSFGMAWMPGIRKAFDGDKVVQITKGECPAWDVAVNKDGALNTACDRQHSAQLAYLKDHKADIVILASAAYLSGRLHSGATGGAAQSELTKGLETTIEAAKSSGAKVFVLGSPPGAGKWTECKTPTSSPQKCWGASNTSTARLVSDASEAASKSAGATYVNVDSWFCSNAKCPAFVGTTPVYADGGHLTVEYSRELSGVLAEAIKD